jgi:PmbA protein
MTLAAIGAQVLDAVRKAASSVQGEAYTVSSESRAQEWSEGKPENQSAARSQGIGLRVIDEGRLGFSSTNRSDGEVFTWLSQTAVEASRVTAPDSNLELPKPVSAGKIPDLELVDPVLAGGSFEERSGFLASIEAKVKGRDKRLAKVLRASYREGRYETAIVSTTGVSAPSAGTSVSFSLACVAVQGAETQVGYGFQAVRHTQDLKIDWVIDKTVEYTLALLGGKQVPSGRYDLVLDPLVAAEMLELVATALRADQVHKGRSFFASKVGQPVGAPSLTIVDDGRLVRGLGSSTYDAEGMPTQTTVLVRDGILQGYLYDCASARRMKQSSTGNAGRASYKGLPEPDSTNFFVRPGAKTPAELMAGIDSGLYVRNVMGLHTVDTVSGEYSLGIMGERIEKGKRTHGVRGVTIAGNLLDLLKDVEAVGNDLTFMGSVGAPTLWIRGVSVGGS